MSAHARPPSVSENHAAGVRVHDVGMQHLLTRTGVGGLGKSAGTPSLRICAMDGILFQACRCSRRARAAKRWLCRGNAGVAGSFANSRCMLRLLYLLVL